MSQPLTLLIAMENRDTRQSVRVPRAFDNITAYTYRIAMIYCASKASLVHCEYTSGRTSQLRTRLKYLPAENPLC